MISAPQQPYLMKAKELDALRFRAPEAINGIIRDLSGKYENVVFVDVGTSFEAHSPGGVIGESLMLEHLHPNLFGHFIIADALYHGVQNKIIPGNVTANSAAAFKGAWKALPLTEVDSLTGVYANWLLREGWPFNEPIQNIEAANKYK